MSRFLGLVLYVGIALVAAFAAIEVVSAVIGVIVTIFFPLAPGVFAN